MWVVVDIVMIQTISQAQFYLDIKSRMACIKMKSTPTSPLVKGQVAKHATVKWAFQRNKNLQ